MDLFDQLVRESFASEPKRIRAIAFGMIADSAGIRQSIFYDYRISADEGITACATELVYPRIGPYSCIILNCDVACQSGSVCHNHAISDDAIMSHVSLGHKETIISDYSYAAAASSAAIERNKLAEDISLAYYQPCLFAFEFKILRDLARRDIREELASFAYLGGALDDTV